MSIANISSVSSGGADDAKAASLQQRATSVAAKTGMFAAVFFLSKSIVSVGLLGFPKAFNEMGLGLGLLVMVLAGALAGITLHLLACVSARMNLPNLTYFEVASRTIPSLKVVLDLAVYVKCIGVGTLFLAAASKSGHSLIDSGFFSVPSFLPVSTSQFKTIFTCFLGFVGLLFSLSRNISRLQYVNYLSMTLMLTLALFLVYEFCFYGRMTTITKTNEMDALSPDVVRPVSYNFFVPETFSSLVILLPSFIFSFTCHQNLFVVANTLENPSLNRLNQVILFSGAFAAVLYLTCGLSGFFMLGELAKSSVVLNDLSTSDVLVRFAHLALLVGTTLSYPLQSYPARASLKAVIFGACPLEESEERKFLYGSTIAMALLCTYLATIGDLGLAFNVVGAIGSNLTSIIIPAALYIAVFRENSPLNQTQTANEEKTGAYEAGLIENAQVYNDENDVHSNIENNNDDNSGNDQELNIRENYEESIKRIEQASAGKQWKLPLAKFLIVFGFIMMPVCIVPKVVQVIRDNQNNNDNSNTIVEDHSADNINVVVDKSDNLSVDKSSDANPVPSALDNNNDNGIETYDLDTFINQTA